MTESAAAATPVDQSEPLHPRGRLPRWEGLVSCTAPLILYLIVRLFAASPYWSLVTDQVDYLVLAQSFPFHRLFNDQVYLIHPPVWPAVIGIAWRVLGLFGVSLATTGLLVEFTFVVATFFLVRAYARRNGVGPAGVAVGLTFLSLSTLVLATQEGISRFPILVAEIGACLILFERWLADEGRKRVPWAVVGLTAVTLLTSDNGLLLFPCYLLIFTLHRSWGKWRQLVVLLALGTLAACVWPGVRLAVYLSHDEFPVGMAGTVEQTRPVPWPGVVQPNLLPITAMHNAVAGGTGIRQPDFRRIKDYLTRLAVPPWVPSRPIIGVLVLASLLPGLRVRLTLKDVRIGWLPDQWRTTVKLFGLTALASLPILVGLYPWYAAPCAIPFAVLLGRGADGLAGWSTTTRRIAVILVTLACAVVSYAWLTQAYMTKSLWLDPLPGRHFLFARTPQTPTAGIGPQLAELGMDPARHGVMTQIGMAEALKLTTGYRAMCIPLHPESLDRLAQRYGIHYILLSEGDLIKPIGGPKARRYSGWDTVRHIEDHPEQYPLIGTPVQTYPDGSKRQFRVYRVAATAGS